MALRNRTEAAAGIEALSAVVDLEELKEAMNDFFAQNCIFRKDVSATDTATTSAKTLDFLDIDYISVTQTYYSVAYTLNNIQQGEVKHLKITKTSGYVASFSGATNVAVDQRGSGAIADATEVLYRITNKDGTNVFVEPIIKELDIGTWQTPSYNANFSAGTNPFQYRLAFGKLEFRGEILSTVTSGSAFTLPAAYRPATDQDINYVIAGAATNFSSNVRVAAAGTVTNLDASGWGVTGSSQSNNFNNVIIID